MKNKMLPVLILVCLIVGCAFSAMAEEKPEDNMKLVLEKIRVDKKRFVGENMQLTESEAKAFWPVYDDYQNELFLLRSMTIKLLTDYSEAFEKMTDETAKKLLDDYISIETLGLKLQQTFLPKFRNVLPEIKVFRYYQIENKINAGLMFELASKIPLIKK